MTASTSSLVGIVLDEPVAVDEGAVLGLLKDVVPEDGEVEREAVLGEEDCVLGLPSTEGGLTDCRGSCVKERSTEVSSMSLPARNKHTTSSLDIVFDDDGQVKGEKVRGGCE